MTDDGINRFEQEHLKRWWETTRYYLFADMESLPGAAAEAEDGWSPPQTDSHGGRKRFIARVRGRLLRSVKSGGKGDPLRELESVFQQQIAFIARHPDVPRRLLSWLAQDGDPGLQRRVRMLIGYYATRLAQIIARAKQQGLVRADIKPHAAATFTCQRHSRAGAQNPPCRPMAEGMVPAGGCRGFCPLPGRTGFSFGLKADEKIYGEETTVNVSTMTRLMKCTR